MKRLTDVQVAEEFLRLKGGIAEDVIQTWAATIAPMVEAARRDEPRINCGAHMWDYTMICDDDDTFESFYGDDYFDGEPPVSYAVISNNAIVYLGDDREAALAAFDKSPNARLERPDSLDALKAILSGDQPKVSAQCCGNDEAEVPDEPSLADYLADGLELLDVAAETFWAEAAKHGVTREKAVTWLESLQDEGSEAAQQAQQLVKVGFNKLGDLLSGLGSKLKQVGEDSEDEALG